MDTLLEFEDRNGAVSTRRRKGLGGWIWEDSKSGRCTLFPTDWTPTRIFHHAIAKGDGTLIGTDENLGKGAK